MIRNFKALGLALVAVFAMSAMVASAASASQFESEGYPVTISGSQVGQHVFSAGSTSVTCETADFHGEASEASSTLTITPTYKDCTAFGFVGATVDMNGCDYMFHSGAEVESDLFDGTVDVVCPEGEAITITAATCALEIGPQNGLSTVSFENNAGGTVTVGANVSSIAYTVTNDGFLCPLSGKGNFTNGSYTGDTSVEGDNGAIGVS